MGLRVATVLVLFLASLSFENAHSIKDEDFAEFEDDDSEFDFEVTDEGDGDDDFVDRGEKLEAHDSGEEDDGDFDDDIDTALEDDDEESFEVELDEEEFEKTIPAGKIDEIELSESAARLGPIWKTYILEMFVVGGMVVYLLNYFIGRTKNSGMANSWLNAHMEILKSNFAIVGDSGEGEDPTEGELVKVCDDTFTLWCSGRQNCSGMLVHMQFCRRHDLMSVVLKLVQPKKDKISLILQLSDEDEMDSFVLAVGTKKTLQRMQKEYEDLKNFITSNVRPVPKAEPLFFLSEIPEATQSFLSERNLSFLAKHSNVIDSIHITDQYTGYVQDTEESETVVVRKPEKRIILNFDASAFDKEGPCLRFALQLLDQIKNIRLSRESRDKAMKNRTTVSASLDKLQHTQRQEAAQQRREDKIRARKEKNMLLSESDPEKARKLEEKENRRARKKMQPKLKSMKVHAS